MINQNSAWYATPFFIRAMQLLGLFEMVGGLALLVLKHDAVQGFALLAIGAGTFGSMPWLGRRSTNRGQRN
jgi:hypothetical protein